MALMRMLTISGGGTLRSRMATSDIIEMPAPAVLAVIHKPIGTIDRMMMNMISAATPPRITRICPNSITAPLLSSLRNRRDDHSRPFDGHHAHGAARLHEHAAGDDVDAL